MITALIMVSAILILGWGLYRALPLGKLGIIAWSQSLVLMLPWLLLFAALAVGWQVNLVGMLLLLVLSISAYVGLGNWLRTLAAQTVVPPRLPELDKGVPLAPASETSTSPIQKHQAKDPVLPTPIADADLQKIRGIFGVNTFFATEIQPYADGVICKGNLRSEAVIAHQQLSDQLQTSLPDQYRLFLVPDPQNKPVVIILPRRNDPRPASLVQKLVALLLALTTVATCLETGAFLRGFNFFEQPQRLPEILTLSLGLLLVLATHELGHWLMARRYRVRLSPPFLIPTWQIGAFGSLVRFESLLPNRKVLLDIALAGPTAGGILSLILLVTGFVLSSGALSSGASNFSPAGSLQVPSLLFQGSVLVGTLARGILGTELQNSTIAVHPLVIVGWLGLVINALNLMPAGQLDGGRIVQAIYGRRVAARSTVVTLILLGLASLANPLALYWALVILLLQRDLERPSLEEVSEVDDARALWGLVALFLMAATVIPLAPALAGRLGVGI